jgi:hypothetical protein
MLAYSPADVSGVARDRGEVLAKTIMGQS